MVKHKNILQKKYFYSILKIENTYFRGEKYEKRNKKTINDNGSYKIVEKIETNLDDGFVHEADIHDVNIDNYGKYSKGYSKSYTFTTNDPRITRPFVYGCCGLFFGIGIICLLLDNWLFGISFILSSILLFCKAKKILIISNIHKKERGIIKKNFQQKKNKNINKK